MRSRGAFMNARVMLFGGDTRKAQRRQASPGNLLGCAGHVVVPVHEGPLWVVAPRPNVQFEERRQAVTVWSTDVLHQVTLHLRSGVGWKSARENYELDADQLQFTIRLRLIDQRLWVRGVNGSVQQVAIDVVDAPGSMVRAAYAA